MRDAFGGIANMAIIIIFLVLVSGYLAFNVNYTKAFRVKNKIISVFEQYEGNCKDATLLENTCNGEIQKYMKSVGYSAPDFNMGGEKGWTCNYGYCYKGVRIKGTSDTKKKGYFKIVKAAFGQRRKTLLNALSNSPAIPMAKEGILKVLNDCGIDEKRRGETLSLKDFADISNAIFDC